MSTPTLPSKKSGKSAKRKHPKVLPGVKAAVLKNAKRYTTYTKAFEETFGLPLFAIWPDHRFGFNEAMFRNAVEIPPKVNLYTSIVDRWDIEAARLVAKLCPNCRRPPKKKKVSRKKGASR